MIDVLPTKNGPRKSLETFVRLEPLRFAARMRDAVLDMDGVGRVMLLVAMLNLDTVADAVASANEEIPRSGSIWNLDDLLFLLSLSQSGQPDGSAARRRLVWLSTAALMNRLGELTLHNRKLLRSLQEIWIELVRSGEDVRTVLASDDVWHPAQARRLLMLFERYQGRDFVTFEMMPKWLFKFQTTRRYLRQNNIDLFPEVWRPRSAHGLPV
ncbi:MAG: hypothetical protein AB7O95_25885 [Geminicoccaceae bacterium]